MLKIICGFFRVFYIEYHIIQNNESYDSYVPNYRFCFQSLLFRGGSEPLTLFCIFLLTLSHGALFPHVCVVYDDEFIFLETSLCKTPWDLCQAELLWERKGLYFFLPGIWVYFKCLIWDIFNTLDWSEFGLQPCLRTI